ncbi:MAG: Txe/YoeB family addiction module toxin [Alphaproteobacteria bacterium]|nr:Txe/YoeB family addiction module toxin [Alphaproteobacteria bacterium]
MAKRDPAALDRVLEVLIHLSASPFGGLHKPEPLRHDLAGFWSVRLNQRDRLIYRVDGERLEVHAIEGHYGDR